MDGRISRILLTPEAQDFLDALPRPAFLKIIYNMKKVMGGVLDNELFKKLAGTEIWEFRTLFGGQSYRLFSFWDTEKETLVVATHGIVKKTSKTPSREIRKAEAIREAYFKTKNNNDYGKDAFIFIG